MLSFFKSFIVFTLVVLFCGCGSGSGSSQVGSTLVGGDGEGPLIVRSDDGVLTLSFPPGSLPAGVDVAVQTLDGIDEVVGGRVYNLTPSGTLLRVPAEIQFDRSLLSQTSGRESLALVAPDGALVPLKTRLEGTNLSGDLNYLTGIGLTNPTPALTDLEAEKRFLEQYAPTLTVFDLVEVHGTTPFVFSRAGYGPFPVVPGNRLDQSGPAYTVSRDQDGYLVQSPFQAPGLDVTAGTDFFWVDLGDGLLSKHPSIYVVFDRDTGEFCERVFGSAPSLNGVQLVPTIGQSDHPKRLFGSMSIDIQPQAQNGGAHSDKPILAQEESDCGRVALILTTSQEDTFDDLFSQFNDELNSIGFKGKRYTRVLKSPKDFTDLIQEIKTYQEEVCGCDGFNEVFVYLTGHGTSAYTAPRLLGFIPVPWDEATEGSGMDFQDRDGNSFGDNALLFETVLQQLTTQICLSKTGRFKVIVEACYTQEILEIFDRIERKAQAGEFLLPAQKQILCFRGDVLVSSSQRTGWIFSGAMLLANRFTTGTGLVLDTSGLIDMNNTFRRAFGASLPFTENPFLTASNPTLTFVNPKPDLVSEEDCACDCEKKVAISIENSPLDFEHIVNTTPCPQTIGTIEVSNLSEEEVMVQLTPGPNLAVNPTSATLSPGASRTFTVQFVCTVQNSFASSVMVQAVGATQEISRTIPVNGSVSN